MKQIKLNELPVDIQFRIEEHIVAIDCWDVAFYNPTDQSLYFIYLPDKTIKDIMLEQNYAEVVYDKK